MKAKKVCQKILLFSGICIITNESLAQSVGIGTTTPNVSSALEVTSPSNNKGLLIPRVALLGTDDKTTIGDPAHTLLVYNTTDDQKLFFYGPGYYFNDGDPNVANWKKLLTETDLVSSEAWLLNGNFIFDPNQFIGSINDENVIFKRNNEQVVQFYPGGSVVFTGNPTTGITPVDVNGAGARVMWMPKQGAFRAGSVSSTEWDAANIGDNSFATGFSTIALGYSSTAMGESTSASGYGSTAMGYRTAASGLYSTTLGSATKATNIASTSMGESTTASGYASTTMGYKTVASGSYSIAMGNQDSAKGSYSIAMGNNTIAFGSASTAMGYLSSAQGDYSVATGYSTHASNIASTAMGIGTIASGSGSTAIGNSTLASKFASLATGYGTIASGEASTAMGSGSSASGDNSFATGNLTEASGETSTAMGNGSKALGIDATSMGNHTNAWGDYSFAAGQGTSANAVGSVALGRYNIPDMLAFKDPACTDLIFQIGNGTVNMKQDALWLTRKADLFIGGTFFPNKGVVCVSDIRLKEDILPLDSALKKINNIQPITYYFKDKSAYSDAHQIGFSAQEIQATFPELVNTNDKGFLAVNYPQMTAVAIQAIKEQQQIINAQQQSINQLNKNNENLKNEVIQLQNQMQEVLKKVGIQK